MDQTITILTGPDRVRRRPGVIFGSQDSQGIQCMLEMLLNLMASECQRGHASELTITHYMDGSFEIQDDGRGLYLGSGKPEDDQIWKDRLCDLFCYSVDPHDKASHEFSYFEPTGLVPCREYECEPYWGIDLCAVQYASAFMDVTVVRDGKEFYLHFEKGENIGGLSVKVSNAPVGTKIRFKPDDTVFTDVDLPGTFLPEQMKKLALLVPRVRFSHCKEHPQGMDVETFCFPDGISGAFPQDAPIFTAEIAARGKDRYNRPEYGAKLKVALCFSRDQGYTQAFHNLTFLPLGGHHVTAILDQITKHLQWQLDISLESSQIQKHLCLVVHTTATQDPSWGNGNRTWITNTMITDMAKDCVDGDFAYYIKCHRHEILPIFGIHS